jgi:hypothetical protein
MIELGSETLWDGRVSSEDDGIEATVVVLSTAELAECTCPEFCERDHDVD